VHQPFDKLVVTFSAFFGLFALLTISQRQKKEKTPVKKKKSYPQYNDKKESGGDVVRFFSNIVSVVSFGVFRPF
jgi:hypothetical protein